MNAFLPVTCFIGALIAGWHLVSTLLYGHIRASDLAGLPRDAARDEEERRLRRLDRDGDGVDMLGRPIPRRHTDLVVAGAAVPLLLMVAVPDLATRATRATAIAGGAALVGVVALWRLVAGSRSEHPSHLVALSWGALAHACGLAPFSVVGASDVERPWDLTFAWMAAATATSAAWLTVRALRRAS